MSDAKTTRRRVIFEPSVETSFALRVVACPTRSAVGDERTLGGSLEVGRQVDDWTIDDATLSRRHFRVTGRTRFVLEDLGASNPTSVDGAQVPRSGQRELSDGSVILAGGTVFVLERRCDDDDLMLAHDVDGERAGAFLGESWAAHRVRRALETAATSEGPVLLLGPTGAGKEVSARLVHDLSDRRGAFVPVNCAAIPKELAEAYLLGHAKGAFTGADSARPGAFVEADGGTLFLDELGELPPDLQSKLLRVIQDGVVQPVGGSARTVDVRVVAATNRAVDAGDDFRRDLYARLAHWIIRLPPLNARRADVLPLFRAFAPQVVLAPEVEAALTGYAWPGNVRELQKLALRAERLARPGVPVRLHDLPSEMRKPQPEAQAAPAKPSAKAPPSREQLEAALAEHGGNINLVAKANGWHRMQIYRWIEKHGIDRDEFR